MGIRSVSGWKNIQKIRSPLKPKPIDHWKSLFVSSLNNSLLTSQQPGFISEHNKSVETMGSSFQIFKFSMLVFSMFLLYGLTINYFLDSRLLVMT